MNSLLEPQMMYSSLSLLPRLIASILTAFAPFQIVVKAGLINSQYSQVTQFSIQSRFLIVEDRTSCDVCMMHISLTQEHHLLQFTSCRRHAGGGGS